MKYLAIILVLILSACSAKKIIPAKMIKHKEIACATCAVICETSDSIVFVEKTVVKERVDTIEFVYPADSLLITAFINCDENRKATIKEINEKNRRIQLLMNAKNNVIYVKAKCLEDSLFKEITIKDSVIYSTESRFKTFKEATKAVISDNQYLKNKNAWLKGQRMILIGIILFLTLVIVILLKTGK